MFKKLVKNNPTKYPARLGKPWGKEEIVRLLESVKNKKTLKEMAEEHERTVCGISCQLKKIAGEYYFNNELPVEKIKKFTGLSDNEIEEVIKKYSVKYKKPTRVEEPVKKEVEISDMSELLRIVRDIREKVTSQSKIETPINIHSVIEQMSFIEVPPEIMKKSKGLLQKLGKSPFEIYRYPMIQKFLKALWTDLFREAIFKGKTKYVLNNFSNVNRSFDMLHMRVPYQQAQTNQTYMQDPTFIQELVEAVKKEYEDCAVEYHETKGYDGKVIEKVLVIDWS